MTEEFFLKLFVNFSIKRVYQIHETGDRQSIHKKIISPKQKTYLIIRKLWGK